MVRYLASVLFGAAALVSGVLGQNSSLGTEDSPTYNNYIAVSPSTSNSNPPWGQADTTNTNPYTSPPNTNQTRKYDFTVSRGTVNVNGVKRSVILVNNQFPGPTIEANWGDMFQITVRNNISDEGTSLHWHGLLQKGTQSMDGVPGIDQCPIAPGQTHTYTFQADLYGSSWWHSHYTAQYAAGLFGPMIIHGPLQKGLNYTTDKGPVILSDWAYPKYEDLVEQAVGVNQTGIVTSNISLINGKTDASFNFTSGQSYRLRLINTAAEASYVYSIDEHEFTVIAHDFVPVTPYKTKNITLHVAQRADIIVNATGKAGSSYYMRSTAQDCSTVTNKNALAKIFYQNADRSKNPTSTPVNPSTACGFPDPSLGIPAYSITPPSQPADITYLNISNGMNSSHNPLFFINGSSFRVNYNEPPLLLASQGNTSYPSTWNVYNHGSNSSVRIVLYNSSPAQHPMHLHGHNFWVVAQGYGRFQGKLNFPNQNNPVRRDTYLIAARQDANTPSYIVIEYNQDNPGVWPFHCHIAWHVSAGLYTSQLERPKDIGQQPQSAFDTCTTWSAWQKKGNIVDQIDSGERR